MDHHSHSDARTRHASPLLKTNQRKVNIQLCRWYNQLSPAITKAPWTTQEEEKLFAAHAKLGNKWKEIARDMPGRTDNSVKNHFYSTVRRALRRLDKHFGFRDSTKKMRGLKPAALTLLLETARTLPDYSSTFCMIEA